MKYDNFFFHIGLHKTASTYLQRVVFPTWPGIIYLRHRNIEYFLRLSPAEKYLISCEGLSGATFANLDERLKCIARLAEMFPGANTIIGFRPHGGFVASLYSQYLRYGGSKAFDSFFSSSGPQDHLIWRREDLCFRALIEGLESSFGKPPFVFQMSELRSNREKLLADLAAFLGTAPPPPMAREDRAQNTSLGAWQGWLLRNINRQAGITYSRDGRNRPFPKLARWRMDPATVCHKVLGYLPARPLVPAQSRQQIDEMCWEDWTFVQDYMKSLPFRHL